MRVLCCIVLIFSMAFSPAVALGACASMVDAGVSFAEQIKSSHDSASMDAMGGEDCDSMGEDISQSHDAGCIVACALVGSGFYACPDKSAENMRNFLSIKYLIPDTDPGVATPPLLDPPPPRL